ncbi:hypothetical protein CPC08DRAFT_822268 [Agrocybe pediades]|nr:hypothetical protein CPC08DRAFT_822268 [Agrocybe pediades]
MKEELDAKAAEERRQKEIEAKEREVPSTTPIRANSAGSGSTNSDDPVALDKAFKRYEEKEKSYLSKPEAARKESRSNKSKVEDYDEEGPDEEKRRKAEKAANRKTKSTGPATSSASLSPQSSTSTPHVQHQPQPQPPVSPPPSEIEELLFSCLARLGLIPITGQPHSPPSLQLSPFTNPGGYASHQPAQQYTLPPPRPHPHYDDHTNNSVSSVGNGNRVSNVGNRNIIQNEGDNNRISNAGNNNDIRNFDGPKQQER